ncbi:hypothetical protein SHANETTE_32 [Bacillus phage Shanette]|uniref:Uncharacterized protein n=1 Tax=Bacillus phage Shanette TaxID=1296656 RepID=S5M5C1_9CAUD|nr:hypothetical protein AVV46_gp032 [Bacillus phage Shanette]AGR47131.2 hypothetical protein SHANETTE_32 [Bacillus phage Shanette]
MESHTSPNPTALHTTSNVFNPSSSPISPCSPHIPPTLPNNHPTPIRITPTPLFPSYKKVRHLLFPIKENFFPLHSF